MPAVCFNPRAHAGRDWANVGRFAIMLNVSIHAPTQGATRVSVMSVLAMTSFNPRAHAGRDHGSCRCRWRYRRFNPRAHAGRDAFARWLLSAFSLFQSTRPRRARQYAVIQRDQLRKFQSTRPRRARHIRPTTQSRYDTFQSTRPRRARLSACNL